MKCRLCGNKNLSLIKGTEENYYFCPDCSLIMIEDEEIPDRETELNRYREHDNTHDNQGYVEMFEKFIFCFQNYFYHFPILKEG